MVAFAASLSILFPCCPRLAQVGPISTMNSVRSVNYAIYLKVIFIGILLYPSGAERRIDGADKKIDDRRGKRQREPGTVNWILDKVERFGGGIGSDAVAQTKPAWEEFQPDLKQAEEAFQRLAFGENMKEDLKNAKITFSKIWEGAMPGGGGWGDIGEAWKNLKRDGTEMTKETLGDVLGDVTNDVVGALEAGLSEALSKGNVRAAFQLWRHVLESPGVHLLMNDRRLWEGTERTVRNYLNGFITEESRKYVQRAVNATADFTTHFADLSQNIGKTNRDVFQDISDKMCHLQGATQKLWPITKRTLPLLGYEEYIASAESVIKANIINRVTLTVSACALLGMDPRNDPFLMAVIVAFSLGHLTKDFAENLVRFFLVAFVDSSTLDQMNTIDLVTEMIGGASSCKELGDQSFAFFEGIKGALHPGDEDVDVEDNGDPALRGRLSSEKHTIEKDAMVLRYAIWVAAVVDHPRFSVDGLLLGLGLALMLCGMALGACCREGLVRRRRRQPKGGEARKKIA